MSSEPVPMSPPAAPPVSVGAVLLALGDSIAAGIGAPHVSEGCMAVLAGRLADRHPGLRLVNLAVPGETTATMVGDGGQMDRAEAVIAASTAAGERIAPVTLSIGGNDAMEAGAVGDEVALDHLRANLATILARLDTALRRAGESARTCVAVQTVYNLFDASSEGIDPAVADALAPRRARRRGHNAAIRAAAAAAGVRVVEVAAAFRGRARELTWLGSGDIHPRATGHRAIADAYLEAFGWPEW